MMKQSYIITDLDDTLLNPSYRRIESILATGRNDLAVWGKKVSRTPEKYMTKKEKDIFYSNFNSNKWADLDAIKWDVVQRVKRLQQQTGLPIVILTGRQEKLMKETTFEKIRVLQRHLKIQKVVMRKTFTLPAAQWKIQQVKKLKIHPAYLFEDNPSIISNFRDQFKNIKTIKIK